MPRMKQRHSPKTHDDNANEGKERIETQANIVLPKRKTILLMKAEADAENARRYSEQRQEQQSINGFPKSHNLVKHLP